MRARKASSIVSRETTTASGSSSLGATSSSSRSGYGCSHGSSASESTVATRRERRRSASRHAFVAIRYSHGRSPGPPVEARAPAPRAQERLLDEVLGLVERAEHPVAVDVQLAPVALGHAAEGGLVTGADGGDDGRVRGACSGLGVRGHGGHGRYNAGRAQSSSIAARTAWRARLRRAGDVDAAVVARGGERGREGRVRERGAQRGDGRVPGLGPRACARSIAARANGMTSRPAARAAGTPATAVGVAARDGGDRRSVGPRLRGRDVRGEARGVRGRDHARARARGVGGRVSPSGLPAATASATSCSAKRDRGETGVGRGVAGQAGPTAAWQRPSATSASAARGSISQNAGATPCARTREQQQVDGVVGRARDEQRRRHRPRRAGARRRGPARPAGSAVWSGPAVTRPSARASALSTLAPRRSGTATRRPSTAPTATRRRSAAPPFEATSAPRAAGPAGPRRRRAAHRREERDARSSNASAAETG